MQHPSGQSLLLSASIGFFFLFILIKRGEYLIRIGN